MQLEAYLNNDPFGSGSRVHDGDEEGPKLLDNLAGNLDEKGQSTPGNPLRNGRERVKGDVGVANEVRVAGGFCMHERQQILGYFRHEIGDK